MSHASSGETPPSTIYDNAKQLALDRFWADQGDEFRMPVTFHRFIKQALDELVQTPQQVAQFLGELTAVSEGAPEVFFFSTVISRKERSPMPWPDFARSLGHIVMWLETEDELPEVWEETDRRAEAMAAQDEVTG